MNRTACSIAAGAALATVGLVMPTPGTTAAEAAGVCPPAAVGVLTATPPTHPKTVALTFDDGPSKYTRQILAVLKKHHVHATFFETGAHVAAAPAISRAVGAAGNRLGNHTYMGSFDTLSEAVQASQIDRTTHAITSATGRRPCFFRAPGGQDFGAVTQKLARSRGLSVTHWTVSTGDSGQPGTLQLGERGAVNWIVSNGTTNPGNHPIILMHDGKASPEPANVVSSYRGNTVVALPRIITFYKSRGYVFTDPAGRRFR